MSEEEEEEDTGWVRLPADWTNGAHPSHVSVDLSACNTARRRSPTGARLAAPPSACSTATGTIHAHTYTRDTIILSLCGAVTTSHPHHHNTTPDDATINANLMDGTRSYGACIDPSFDSNRLALLERGVVFAIAHIRGGGEMGRAWCVRRVLHNA